MKDKIIEIIELLQREFQGVEPVPRKSNPLDVLIATILSQNTTDKTSYIAFKNLKRDYRSWKSVMEAPQKKIENSIRVCGLANQKAKSIKSLLKGLSKKNKKLSLDYIKKLPDEKIYEELLQYGGVGVKTISCVLAFALGRDVFPVDTHVHRLTNRLGIANAKTPDKTFEQLKDKIPEGEKFLLHTLLIRFGRKVCRSQSPLCSKCVLYDLCEFEEKEDFAMQTVMEPKENNFIILEHI